ncbi:ABC transporter permease [Micromonospora sp. DT46]|uniref:ABC transporter permease n=1 Tax=Micromonospora sp. DT46 TaxID=3393435 RepID=UPI003CF9C4B0
MSHRVVLASAKVQWHTSIRAPEHLLIVFLAPLFTLIFLSVVRHSDRDDLVTSTVLGTGLLGIWFVAVNVAGGVIQNERWMGTFDLVLVAPRAFALVVCGRILPVLAIGGFTLVESWLVARFAFDAQVTFPHPLVTAATVLVTLAASAGTATMLSSVFVLTRNTSIVQSTLSYPFYVLGGVVFPLSMLPAWVQPLSRIFYLSWASDLLRDSLLEREVPNVVARLGVIAGLGVLALAIGTVLIRRAADRARRTGQVSLA